MDYSFCGYHRSEAPIPTAPVAVYVEPTGGDDAALLQEAIDRVSRQKPDRLTGLRGAVLLGEGTFTLSEPLRIRTSGVIVRGMGRHRTLLRKTGYDRGALIYIEGTRAMTVRDTLDLAADVAPGALTISVQGGSPTLTAGASAASRATGGSPTLTAGARLLVWRPSTEAWINALGCASFGGGKRMGYWAWHPGDIDLRWHRTVTAVRGAELTLDAPLTCSLEQRWGGAKVIVYSQPGLISECGVENLTLESAYDTARPLDEDHCWDGVYVADAEDCWVRMVNFRHFAGSAVVVQQSARQITVEDCLSLEPVSEIGGFRRRTFLTLGEQVLFQRCYSEHGINDFAVGQTAPGPNAFVQCESYESLGPSGAIGSWAPGILFDIVNIDGNDIVFRNWELEKFGAGWSTANSTMWQSTAAGLLCYSPDTLNRNISHGCWGQIQGNGDYTQMNEHVRPYSLFADQLLKRRVESEEKREESGEKRVESGEKREESAVADEVKQMCRVLERSINASSSPTIEEAQRMAQEALQPRLTLRQWIEEATLEASPSPTKGGDARLAGGRTSASTHKPTPSRSEGLGETFSVTNGWLTKNGALLAGGKHQTPWWNGRTTDAAMAKARPALTRFVPGQECLGGTDRVDSVVSWMQRKHVLLFSQNYGLWTDRRRDDHERIRRKNGDAWAPFYEQPFARTGLRGTWEEGTRYEKAWDGMTKYDLTTLNKWYFYRLQQFAAKGAPLGLLLKNQHYFQHNILEAGAHWVDCPWRTANNVNGTPFLEPVNFTGDKRIFAAELFYDVSNPTLRALHRQYIRQSLDAFKGQPNVIHSIGEEFTGPLHFVQFWLDVVSEWEQENGRVLIDLAVNKDVQDSILADPVRSQVVDIIDIEQWFYHNKGEYAPPGGVNMAQRQYMRKIRTGSARFEDVYRAVAEYRTKYPDKAVVYSAQKHPEMCWAALMAGGSCTAIPVRDEALLRSIATMRPTAPTADHEGVYLLDGPTDMLVYKQTDAPLVMVSKDPKGYAVYQVDEKSGAVSRLKPAGGGASLKGKGIFWLRKK